MAGMALPTGGKNYAQHLWLNNSIHNFFFQFHIYLCVCLSVWAQTWSKRTTWPVPVIPCHVRPGSQTQVPGLPCPLPTEPSPASLDTFFKIIVLPLSWSSQWFPMTYSKVNHCDTAFQSSSEFSSSPSDKSGHGHQHTSSTIWYLSSANYIYFTPITSLCSLFSIFLNSIWSSLDLPKVAIPIFQSPHKPT